MIKDTAALEKVALELASARLLAVDLETFDPAGPAGDGGLDPHRGAIRIVTVATRCGIEQGSRSTPVAFVIDASACRSWPDILRPLFADPRSRKVLRNAKFDLKFLSNWGGGEISQEQLRYAAKDTKILLDIHDAVVRELAAAKLSQAALLEMESLPAIAWMELAGAPLDGDAWRQLASSAEQRVEERTEEIQRALGRDLNLDSPKQLIDALRAVGVRIAKTDTASLQVVSGRHRAIPMIIERKDAQKRASTFGKAFVDQHLHPVTGRVHADYHLVGAATGRMSCARPNLQNIPGEPAYRRCFLPGPGRRLVIADLSQIELCVAAELSGDDRLLSAIADHQDLHRITAAALFGEHIEEVTAEQRAIGKMVNFGVIYGLGRRGLVGRLAQHRIEYTTEEAGSLLDAFAAAWPRLWAWRNHKMKEEGRDVRTASGRRRRLDPEDLGTKRVNTPVQGTAADGFKASLALLWRTRNQFPSACPVLAVHDELVVECDEADAEEVEAWVEDCLVQGMRRYLHRVQVRVEVKVASDWAGKKS